MQHSGIFREQSNHPTRDELFNVLKEAAAAAAKAAALVIKNSEPAVYANFWSLREARLVAVAKVIDEILQDEFAPELLLGEL